MIKALTLKFYQKLCKLLKKFNLEDALDVCSGIGGLGEKNTDTGIPAIDNQRKSFVALMEAYNEWRIMPDISRAMDVAKKVGAHNWHAKQLIIYAEENDSTLLLSRAKDAILISDSYFDKTIKKMLELF